MNALEIIFAIATPYVYLTLLGSLFVYLFQKKYNFQTILPVALMGTTLFVFAVTIVFHNIAVAFSLTVVAALSAIIFVIRDKQRWRTLRESIATPGFVIFTIMYVVVLLLNWSKPIPTLSDSSMHWAPHVYTMWLRNDFYTSPGLSIVNHGDYPPAMQLFELLWIKAANVYREGLLLAAIQLLGLVMVLPVFRQLTWKAAKPAKTWLLALVFSGVVLALPLVMSVSNFYSFLDVDTALAFVFGYGVYFAYVHSKKFTRDSIVQLSIIVSFILLTKQIAVIFAFLVILVYITGLFLSYRTGLLSRMRAINLRTLRTHWMLVLMIAVVLLIPLFCKIIWSQQIRGYVSPSKDIAIFHLNLRDTVQIPAIFAHESGSAAQQLFSHAYLKHVLFDPGGLLLNNLTSISFMQIAILLTGVIVVFWLSRRRGPDRKRLAVLGVVLGLGWFLYVLALYAVFLFGGMKDVELNNLALTDRYLATYLFAMLVVVVMLLIEEFVELTIVRKKSKPVIYFAVVLIVVFGALFNGNIVDALGLRATANSNSVMNSYNIPRTEQSLREIAQLSGSTFEHRHTVAVMAQANVEGLYLQYVGMPNKIMTILDREANGTPSEACQTLLKSDYLIVSYIFHSITDQQLDHACIANNITLKINTVYKVTKVGDRVTLAEIDPAP